jgi:hypothetical protein
MNLKHFQSKTSIKGRKKILYIFAGIVICIAFLISGKAVVSYTSSDKYCISTRRLIKPGDYQPIITIHQEILFIVLIVIFHLKGMDTFSRKQNMD